MSNDSLLYPHPNATSIPDFLFTYPNDHLLGGLYGYMLLTMIFSLAFFITLMRAGDARRSLGVASWLTFLSSVMFVPIGLIEARGWAITVILLVVGILVNWNSRGGAA